MGSLYDLWGALGVPWGNCWELWENYQLSKKNGDIIKVAFTMSPKLNVRKYLIIELKFLLIQ